MPATTIAAPTFEERFEALLERARAEHQADRLAPALDVFAEAENLARERGDRKAADRAFANRCTTVVKRDRSLGLEEIQRLREILMAGDDPVVSRLAAYNVARAFECAKQNRKGLFYARIALDRSKVLDSSDWMASSRNQLGNFLLAEGRFQEAREEYEAALELLPPDPSRRKALILTNLGYARVVLELEGGLDLLYRSLRMLRSLGAHSEQVFPHLDLSFALLEVGRYRHALKHGARALALAEESGDADSVKHALFLLGEAAQQGGDPATARETFRQLQERYFPESRHLTDVLLAVDVRKLVNLKG